MRKRRNRLKDTHVSEEQHWQDKWKSTQCNTAGKWHVITMNVGPKGLQACIQRMEQILTHHNSLPAALHFQDVKITQRRAKSLHDQLKRALPDYTAFYEIRPAKHSKRYSLGVLTMLRNDVAYGAKRAAIKQCIEDDATVDSEQRATLTKYCAGRVLLVKTKPPGAKGRVRTSRCLFSILNRILRGV